jgi:hypothetical protein
LTIIDTGERPGVNTGRNTMQTVAIRIVDADFAEQMALMRDWLDRQCSEPTRFIYDQANDEVVVSVEFPKRR